MSETKALIAVEGLTVSRKSNARPLLEDFSLAIAPGETVSLLGEAGSGKDTLLQALVGSLPRGEEASGTLKIRDGSADKIAKRPREGLRIAYLAGPYAKPLSPLASVVSQLSRVIARKLNVPVPAARAEFTLELERLKGAPPVARFEKYPGELDPEILAWGLFAACFAQTPDLLIADDPLLGLGPAQSRALSQILIAEQKRLGFALLYAATGTDIIKRLGGRLIVLRNGRVVEEGPIARLATDQAHAYTRTLFKAMPPLVAKPVQARTGRSEPVLQVHGLEFRHGVGATAAKESVTFELRRGASLALIGEEGSGRHSLMRAVLGLDRMQGGRVILDAVDIGILTSPMMARLRRLVAFISGADDALDPRMTLWDTVAEPLRAHVRLPRSVIADYRESALKRVGLASLPGRRPIAMLSPFDKRRLQVARAMVGAPLLAVIDEPLRGLDAFAQSVMRDLLREFREQEGPAFLVITSDFTVAQALAEDAMVFHDKRIVERGAIADLLKTPKDVRTKRLIEAVSASQQEQKIPSPPPGERAG
ncbi:MAG: ABC transporter ATP-binding protein [Proteobacteria bacterium]|nr:ABC transporter ATP-binding protein [Pseudomonadota bacterium]